MVDSQKILRSVSNSTSSEHELGLVYDAGAKRKESIGKRLKSARESYSVTVAQIAQELNLRSDIITALEADNYVDLPGVTFTKGYLRSYSKLFALDLKADIDALELQPDEMGDLPITKAALRQRGQIFFNRKKRRRLLFPIIILATFLLLGWLVTSIIGRDSDHLLASMKSMMGLPSESTTTADSGSQGTPSRSLIRIE